MNERIAIHASKDVRTALREKFKVSDATISKALSFNNNSQKAATIRKEAVNQFKSIIYCV